MTQPSPGLPPAHLDALAARLQVGAAAQAFREHLAAGDLAGAWPGIDPELRLAWTRHWTRNRRRRLPGVCPNRLATRLAAPGGPTQALWEHFATDQLLALRDLERPGQRARSATLPPLAPDTEVLYADPRHPESWGAPDERGTVPMPMRWNGTAWLVLNYGSALPPAE